MVADISDSALKIFYDWCQRNYGNPLRILKCEIIDGDFTIKVYPKGLEYKDCKIILFETNRDRAEYIAKEIEKEFAVELLETPLPEYKNEIWEEDSRGTD